MWLSALASALLLILAYPPFSQSWCAWIGLVPWLLAVRQAEGRRAWWVSCLVGALFFLGSIWWLIHVTLVGWLVLCAYLSLYFGLFGWALRRWGQGIVFAPALWVSLEYARSHLLSGFGWNLLAYSQTPWLPVIQVADLTGAWGVSFLIVMVNVALAGWFSAVRRARRAALVRLAMAAGLALAAAGYGMAWMASAGQGTSARIAVVQGNIPQEEKWDEARKDAIGDAYEVLTRQVAAHDPDLIVWPETSVPGYFGLDEPLTQRISRLAASIGVPLLVGAPMSHLEGMVWRTTNSAILVEADGNLGPRYDKLHLVPFGEFVPGEPWLPWFLWLLPPIGDFTPGRDYTVFHLSSRLKAQGSREDPASLELSASSLQLPFSVLICFEDIFPELARRFVLEGARLLVVITNDAWFGPTAAAYQHAQASAFRAVELRVPVVRAANTGWSGCLDAGGRRVGAVRDARGRELFVAGTHTCAPPPGPAGSLYLRWGDWFALLCLAAVICRVGIRRV